MAHCGNRTDYYLVGTTAHYDDWETTGHAIDCKTTKSCNNVKIELGSECTSVKWDVGGSLKGAVDKSLAVVKGELGIEFRGSYGKDNTICTSTSDHRCVFGDMELW
jgi:hypothetical protein